MDLSPSPLDFAVLLHRQGPVILVEPSDNIGGGAPGDGTGLLRALLEHHVEKAVVVINDPDAVSSVSGLAIGSSAHLSIGGKGSPMDTGRLPWMWNLSLGATAAFRWRILAAIWLRWPASTWRWGLAPWCGARACSPVDEPEDAAVRPGAIAQPRNHTRAAICHCREGGGGASPGV